MRRTWPGDTKCGMSTNGIVVPAKTTSCSASQPSISRSRSLQPSPSLLSSTRCCSFRLLTWSITPDDAPSLRVQGTRGTLLGGLDPERGGHRPGELHEVRPREGGALEALDAADAFQVAFVQQRAVEPRAAQLGLAQVAALEDDVGQRGLVQI